MNYPYKISVVICSHNSSKFIIAAIESIFRQDFDKRLYEVIVVDSNSTDSSPRLVENFKAVHPQYNIQIFREKNEGISWARTNGAKEAKGEVIAYLDDHAEAHSGWLSAIATFFDANADAYAVGGRVVPKFLSDIPDWYSDYFHGLVGALDEGDEPEILKGSLLPSGSNMAFRKKAFEKIGYFNVLQGIGNKGFLASEEKDIFTRILAARYKIYYLPSMLAVKAIEEGRFGTTFVHSYASSIGGGERLRLKKKTGQLLKKLIEFKISWLRAVVVGLRFLFKGHNSQYTMMVAYRWWVLMGFLHPQKAASDE